MALKKSRSKYSGDYVPAFMRLAWKEASEVRIPVLSPERRKRIDAMARGNADLLASLRQRFAQEQTDGPEQEG